MKISGKEYSREELLRRNNPDALFGARRVELADGHGKGLRLIEVKTAAGLSASFAEDKCLDIIDLSYNGVNLAFLSKNGLVTAPLANPNADSFLKYWQGGFMSTCGLRNSGPSCRIDKEFFPFHGHVGQMPASRVNVKVDEEKIKIKGRIRESSLFGHCLEMERKITIPSDGASIKVKDTIYNLTPEPETILFLYHINFGFPFLSEDLVLKFPEAEVSGRTDLAQERIADHAKITPPIDGEPEVVYFHKPKEKDVEVSLTNKALGIKAAVSYDSENLPVLAQWKCMHSGDYALGIEPGTSHIRGRKEELENGYDVKVPGFGKLKLGFTVTFETV
jgi:hypothetical protein